MTSWATLKAIGQPGRRLANSFRYCASDGALKVELSSAGLVTRVVKS